MGILLDTPLIRQESHATCWFAAGRMLKAYSIEDASKKQAFVERSERLQRGVIPDKGNKGLAYDSHYHTQNWLFHKANQGRLYASDKDYIPEPFRQPLPVEERPRASTERKGLSFHENELDTYLKVESLSRLDDPSLIKNISKSPYEQTSKDREIIFNDMENALRMNGPLMTSLCFIGTSASHAVVITGVFQTNAEQTYPAYYLPVGNYGKPESSPKSEYWVVINDPGGSVFTVDSTMLDDPKKERSHIRAEQYYIPLEDFVNFMHVDMENYSEKLGFKIDTPVFIYNPQNKGVLHELRLPEEAINTNNAKPSCNLF